MKALLGAWDHQPHKLLAEITALRSKVAQLQSELAEARAENAVLREMQELREVRVDADDALAASSA